MSPTRISIYIIMKPIYLALIAIHIYAVFDLDQTCEVYIDANGSVQVSLKSNLSTGFSWIIDSEYIGIIQTEDLEGTYTPDDVNLIGAGGIQT